MNILMNLKQILTHIPELSLNVDNGEWQIVEYDCAPIYDYWDDGGEIVCNVVVSGTTLEECVSNYNKMKEGE